MKDEIMELFPTKKQENRENRIVLITGGAGFIGSNFIRYLRNHYPHYKIINFDKLSYAGNLKNLTFMEANPNYVFVKGDVANQRDVKTIFEEFNPHFVVHFAAESHVDRSLINPDQFLQTNILGTQLLLQTARQYSVEKFVFLSTDEVYGSIPAGCECDEQAPIKPNNYYSVSKAAADFLVQVAFKTYGQRINIIRCCNNYGSFQFPEKLIPLMISNALNDRLLPVYGDGSYFRDWLHVEDHCRAIDKVLHQGRCGEIYNVGAKNEWKNIDLVNYLLELLKKPKSLISYVFDRPAHDLRYSINFDKIRQELNWKPVIDFKQGIKQTVEWYAANQEWINEITTGEYMKYYNLVYKNRTIQKEEDER
jgi:dTDP-glucose 4,6-dehydratase